MQIQSINEFYLDKNCTEQCKSQINVFSYLLCFPVTKRNISMCDFMSKYLKHCIKAIFFFLKEDHTVYLFDCINPPPPKKKKRTKKTKQKQKLTNQRQKAGHLNTNST